MATTEQQLRLYRQLVEHSLGLMCIHDLEGVLLAINPAAAESLGYSVSEGEGRNLGDFLAPSVRPLFPRYLQRLRQNGADSGLMRLVAKDGSQRVWMYRNVLYSEGSDTHVLGQALDVTERIAIESALKQAHRELTQVRDELTDRVARRTEALEKANEELKAEMEHRAQMQEELIQAKKLESVALLAGGIAHDFNNFLTIVQSHAEEARRQVKPDDDTGKMLTEISKACARATRLAAQLLTFGKGGAPVRRAPSLADLLYESAELALAGSNVKCEFQLAQNLSMVNADPGQIVQVLHNILLNARQAMPDGGVVRVEAANLHVSDGQTTLAPGNYVHVLLQDSGCGIGPEDLPRVFDPYFTTKDTGRGLGLATAHAIISKHNGKITVESTPGVGATFILDLPASAPQALAVEAPSAASKSRTHRVLVMDDEEAIRSVLSRILERLGYEVECAADGAEAVSLFKAALERGSPFSAVLLDLTVPGGTGGKEAVVHLRKIDPSVKTIASSGYSDGPIMAEYQQFGFDDVLPKPWTAARVAEVLARVMNRQG